MLEKQLPLEGNEALVEEYFRYLFRKGEKRVLDSLRTHCNLESYDLDPYVGCEFSAQYLKGDVDYFGENVVGIYYAAPVQDRDKDILVILSYEEFYAYAEREYTAYAEKHKHCKEEIKKLLKQLKGVLLDN